MIQIIGWIGLTLLVFSFGLLITKYNKYFIVSNLIATIFLFIHSLIIKDLPLTLAQAFIITFLSIKTIQENKK